MEDNRTTNIASHFAEWKGGRAPICSAHIDHAISLSLMFGGQMRCVPVEATDQARVCSLCQAIAERQLRSRP